MGRGDYIHPETAVTCNVHVHVVIAPATSCKQEPCQNLSSLAGWGFQARTKRSSSLGAPQTSAVCFKAKTRLMLCLVHNHSLNSSGIRLIIPRGQHPMH